MREVKTKHRIYYNSVNACSSKNKNMSSYQKQIS